MRLNVLIGCERTGTVREEFRKRGHNAWSCDLLPPLTGSSRHHIESDVLRLLDPELKAPGSKRGWDIFIVHPPCTYLSASGMHWNDYRPERERLTIEALKFVIKLFKRSRYIPGFCLENPVGAIGTSIKPCTQSIQPYDFGDDASKRTCLWLRGLPLLKPTRRVPGRWVIYRGKRCERWGNQTDSGNVRLNAQYEREIMHRSATFPGVARAMARQWSKSQGDSSTLLLLRSRRAT